MSANLETSVILVSSKDDDNPSFGTGFVVQKTSNSSLVVTCAHVVHDVGGKDKIKIGDYNVNVIAIGTTSSDDLALLQVNGVVTSPPLKLGSWGEMNMSFKTAGFHEFGSQFSSRTVHGKLGKSVDLQDRLHSKRVSAWELKITDTDILKEGYSGSPVVDTKTGYVMAVVSHRHRDGKKGVAISISLLAGIWGNTPPDLISSKEDVTEELTTSDEIASNKIVPPQKIEFRRQPAPKPPERLIEEIASQNVIPVIGAGLSMGV